MFDPGGAVRPECSYQGGGVVPRQARDDNVVHLNIGGFVPKTPLRFAARAQSGTGDLCPLKKRGAAQHENVTPHAV